MSETTIIAPDRYATDLDPEVYQIMGGTMKKKDATTLDVLRDYKTGKATRRRTRATLLARSWNRQAVDALIDMVDKDEILTDTPRPAETTQT